MAIGLLIQSRDVFQVILTKNIIVEGMCLPPYRDFTIPGCKKCDCAGFVLSLAIVDHAKCLRPQTGF